MTVTLYLEKITLKVKDASEQGLARAAQQLSGLAKARIQENGQVDTGFMLNSIYAVIRRESDYAEARAAAEDQRISSKTGRAVDPSDRMAPERSLPSNAVAAVVVGANYAVFQEARASFLYAAAQELAQQIDGTLEPVFKEVVRD